MVLVTVEAGGGTCGTKLVGGAGLVMELGTPD
jgi:hypothetical protein